MRLPTLFALALLAVPLSADADSGSWAARADAGGADRLMLLIHDPPGRLQYGNVLRFEVELMNDSNASADLKFACFGGADYVVSLRKGSVYEEVYRDPLCWSVVEEAAVPPAGSIRWRIAWEQVVWNRGNPDDPADPQGYKVHAPLGDYRVEVRVAPFNHPAQLRASFDFRLIDSEFSRPEVAVPASLGLAAVIGAIALLQVWRSRNPIGPEQAMKAMEKRLRDWLRRAVSIGAGAMRRLRRGSGAEPTSS